MMGVVFYIVGGNVGLLSIFVFIGLMFIYVIIGFVIVFVVGIVVVYLFGFEDVLFDGSQQLVVGKSYESSGEIIYSLIKGEVKVLSEVNDGVFFVGIMGKGFVIEFEEGEVVLFVYGSVIIIFKIKYVIGIMSDQGVEIFIYIGLDMVKFEG